MIIRNADKHLLFITQPDHAQLSRRVMEACTQLTTNPRRVHILHAIGEHDNGWLEPDAAPIVDPASGKPFDFVSAPAAVRQDVWPRGVRRLAQDPWAAALVAQHAITVYDRYASDAQWMPFFVCMKNLRDEMRRSSGEDPQAIANDYAFVRLGDLISLAFCTSWTDPLGFAGWTVTRSGPHVRVSPDPFETAVIPLEIQARELRQGPYSTDAELRAEFAHAKVITLQGTVTGT